MDYQKHTIQKVFFEVETNSIAVAHDLKNRLGVFLKEDILSYLEKYLKSIEQKLPAEIVQIPQLTLDIKTTNQDNFKTLKTDIKEKLVQKIDAILKAPSQTKEEVILINSQEHQTRSLLFFIENGYTPWWKTTGDQHQFTYDQIVEIASNNSFSNQYAQLLQKLVCKKRSIQQFTDQELQILLKTSFKHTQQVCVLEDDIIKTLTPLSTVSRDFIWSEIISYLQSKNIPIFIDTISSVIIKNRPIENQDIYAFAKAVLAIIQQVIKISKSDVAIALQKETKNISQNNASLASQFMTICNKIGLSKEATTILKPFLENPISDIRKSKEIVVQDQTHSELKEELFLNNTGTYYVPNAGLIIVHPYLTHFFTNCGLLDNKNTIVDQEVAVHALHYLATKKEQQLESNMVFEKFLCGIPIQESIQRHIVLSDYIKKQAEELLQSVIENWGVLNNTSTDLLRHEFIQREGKLSFTEDNPKIVIERKTQDILIDKIPWGIGICRLPWLDHFVFTNW